MYREYSLFPSTYRISSEVHYPDAHQHVNGKTNSDTVTMKYYQQLHTGKTYNYIHESLKDAIHTQKNVHYV